MKKLKLWNIGDLQNGRYYIGAHSMAHAARLLEAAGRKGFTYSYFREYASPNCWGLGMEHITPDVGVWYLKTGEKEPTKLV